METNSRQSKADVSAWTSARKIFKDVGLAELLEVSEPCIEGYAVGDRAIPAEVEDRLDWLTRVVGDLSGAYNDFGIRRWFDRHRVQLSGASPRQHLGECWASDNEAAIRVSNLASSLSGPLPLDMD